MLVIAAVTIIGRSKQAAAPAGFTLEDLPWRLRSILGIFGLFLVLPTSYCTRRGRPVHCGGGVA